MSKETRQGKFPLKTKKKGYVLAKIIDYSYTTCIILYQVESQQHVAAQLERSSTLLAIMAV